MRKPVLLGVIFAGIVLAVIVYTSFGNRKFRCEVCVAYQGRTACRKAAAATKESARRAATDNACAQIASGITASMVCTGAEPISVKWLE